VNSRGTPPLCFPYPSPQFFAFFVANSQVPTFFASPVYFPFTPSRCLSLGLVRSRMMKLPLGQPPLFFFSNLFQGENPWLISPPSCLLCPLDLSVKRSRPRCFSCPRQARFPQRLEAFSSLFPTMAKMEGYFESSLRSL